MVTGPASRSGVSHAGARWQPAARLPRAPCFWPRAVVAMKAEQRIEGRRRVQPGHQASRGHAGRQARRHAEGFPHVRPANAGPGEPGEPAEPSDARPSTARWCAKSRASRSRPTQSLSATWPSRGSSRRTGCTITLKLRQGVKWHNKAPVNGRAVDVDDVLFSWNRFAAKGATAPSSSTSANPDAPILSMTATGREHDRHQAQGAAGLRAGACSRRSAA